MQASLSARAGVRGKRVFAGVFVAVLLAGVAGLALLASSGTAAGPSQYQYKKPSLVLSVQVVDSTSYALNLSGTGYNSGTQPGGTLSLTCGGKKGSACGPPPPPWPPGESDANGSFSFLVAIFDCGSNVKSVVARDANGVTSNTVKGAC